MYVLTDLFNMLKNGSRIGNLLLPQHAKCYKMCGQPLESDGNVLNMVAKVLSWSLVYKW